VEAHVLSPLNVLIESTGAPAKLALETSSRGFGVYARAAVIATLMVVLYGGVLKDLVGDWLTAPGQSQGILIPPLALYFAWMQRESTAELREAYDSRGLIAIGGACLLFLIGRLGAEFFLTRLSFVALLAGLLWTYTGLARLRSLGFPFLLLVTMIPLPSLVYASIVAPLQVFASTAGAKAARMFGVAVFQDGNIINLAGIALGVDEACSGLHSLMALAVAGLILGFVQTSNGWMRALLLALALPVSVAMNIVRIAGTAILADSNEKFALGFYHSFSGWLVFVFGFLCLLAIAKLATGISGRSGAQAL
jgi:exosortase